MEKIQVSQDFLFEYLTEHNITLTRLTEMMGVSSGIVIDCFHHNLNRLGKPQSFSPANIVRLNAALENIAGQIRGCVIEFGSEKTITTRLGRTYDPGAVPAVKALSKFFNLNAMCLRVLGWKKGKKESVLCTPNSKVYGFITADNIMRINTELLQVSSTLGSMEVKAPLVSTKDDCDNSLFSSNKNPKENKKRGHPRKTIENNFKSPEYEWDNTLLSLPERSRIFRNRFPNGLLLFRVNGGYTAEGEDADFVHSVCQDIEPYIDVTTGLKTAFMDDDTMVDNLASFVSEGRRVLFTDMYPNK